MSVNNEISDDLTSHTIDLMRFDSGTRAKVRGVLILLERDIIKQIEKIDLMGPDVMVWRLNRLEKLLKSVRDSIRASYRENKKILNNDITELVNIEAKEALAVINDAVGVEVATVTLTPEVVREIAKDTIIRGAPSADWWGRQAQSLQNRFADEVRNGMLAGEANQDIVRRIRGSATGKREFAIINGKRRFVSEFTGGIMDVTTTQAEALVRTSVQAVANNARMETYKVNDDIINGVQTLATLDLRTTDICKARSPMAWSLDGKPLNSVTNINFPGPPPWHWNCRTTLTPITKSWEDLGARKKGKIAKESKSTQASMDGQVPETLDYESWLKKQTKVRQIKALGKGRWELWKEGKIKNFTELIDQTGRPLTIEQLKKKRK